MPGPSNHNAAATLPPCVGPRGLSLSAGAGIGIYGHGHAAGVTGGEASPATAARQYSYPAPNMNVPFHGHSNTLPANFPGQQSIS